MAARRLRAALEHNGRGGPDRPRARRSCLQSQTRIHREERPRRFSPARSLAGAQRERHGRPASPIPSAGRNIGSSPTMRSTKSLPPQRRQRSPKSASKLNLRGGLRAVGDRKATVRRVLLFPGSMTPATMWKRYAEADMLIAGEVREWENTHYAADILTAGEKRALVTIGRVVSRIPACAPAPSG